jgi:hypothetical protein
LYASACEQSRQHPFLLRYPISERMLWHRDCAAQFIELDGMYAIPRGHMSRITPQVFLARSCFRF